MKEHLDEFLEKIDSPVQQELIEQKYKFVHFYSDHDGKEKTATVLLHINFESQTFKVYESQTFKVYPGDGSSEFGFVTGSHKFNMWIATTKCISAAIEFAVETLNLQPNESSFTS